MSRRRSRIQPSIRCCSRRSGPFGRAILEIGERRPDVVALSADVAGVTGLAPFAQAFPDRFVNVGMAEENLISVAVGLEKAGFVPVATTFAVFATRRALDFIAIQCALNRANVKIVAALPGIYSTFGPDAPGHRRPRAHARAAEHDGARPVRQRGDGGGDARRGRATTGPSTCGSSSAGRPLDVDRAGTHVRDRPGAAPARGHRRRASSRAGSWFGASQDAAADARRARHLRGAAEGLDAQAVRRPAVRRRLRRGTGAARHRREPLGDRRALLGASPRRWRRSGIGRAGPPVGVRDEFCSFGSNDYVARTHGLTAEAVVAAVDDVLAARR